MDFLPHFEELRRRLFTCFAVFVAASIGAYFFSSEILEFFIQPLRRHFSDPLVFHKPYEAFLLHVQTAAFTGFLISSPFILTQLWFFLAPGLYEKEKKVFLPVVLASIALFLTGVLFAYAAAVPVGLQFMLDFQTESLKPFINANSYFSFVIGMMIAFGILFDFPVIILGLTELGAVKVSWLREGRKGIVVIIFVASAILTPSPDPVSQILLAGPLWLLFELSLSLAAYREGKKRRLAAGPQD